MTDLVVYPRVDSVAVGFFGINRKEGARRESGWQPYEH
jgi:hypothetical protein